MKNIKRVVVFYVDARRSLVLNELLEIIKTLQ